LIYGEAQQAPTKKDFIHKVSLVLRELRETHINLQIIEQSHLFRDQNIMREIVDENSQLIAIFTKTYQNARRNEMDETQNSKLNYRK